MALNERYLCEYCLTSYLKTSKGQKYCSTPCAKISQKEKRRIWQQKDKGNYEPRNCKACGALFKFRYSKLYCRDCRDEVDSLLESGLSLRWAYKKVRDNHT